MTTKHLRQSYLTMILEDKWVMDYLVHITKQQKEVEKTDSFGSGWRAAHSERQDGDSLFPKQGSFIYTCALTLLWYAMNPVK